MAVSVHGSYPNLRIHTQVHGRDSCVSSYVLDSYIIIRSCTDKLVTPLLPGHWGGRVEDTGQNGVDPRVDPPHPGFQPWFPESTFVCLKSILIIFV